MRINPDGQSVTPTESPIEISSRLESNAEDDCNEHYDPLLESQEILYPTRWFFLFAFLGICPCLIFTTYNLGYFTVVYYALHLCLAPLAIKVQDRSRSIRWPCGFVTLGLLSGTKTTLFLTLLKDSSFTTKVLLYPFTALWECSNAVLVFGGRSMLVRNGITTNTHALLYVLCPAQMRFIDTDLTSSKNPDHKMRWLLRTFHLAGYLAFFFLMRFLLGYVKDPIEAVPVLESEALVILTSCLVNVWNVPSHVWQLCMLRYPTVQVIYPYGSLYCSDSSRTFWSRWSRPAGSLVRQMFYYPCGGSQRAWLAVPLMFFLNASSHYDVGNAIVGSRSEVGWNMVFGILGAAVTLELYGNKWFSDGGDEEQTSPLPRWYVFLRFLVAAVSLRVAAFFFYHKCLLMSISSLL